METHWSLTYCSLCGKENIAYQAEMNGTYGNMKCAPGVGYYPGHRVSLCDSCLERVLERKPVSPRTAMTADAKAKED